MKNTHLILSCSEKFFLNECLEHGSVSCIHVNENVLKNICGIRIVNTFRCSLVLFSVFTSKHVFRSNISGVIWGFSCWFCFFLHLDQYIFFPFLLARYW